MKHLISKKFINLSFLFSGVAIIFCLNLQEAYASTVSYYVYDAPNRNVASLVNTFGTIVNSYSYDSFGNTVNKTEEVGNNFKYVGEQCDKETDLIFLRNRYYNYSTGRFITKDFDPGRKQNPQTKNPYPYCRNNPVNLIDPLGLDAYFMKTKLDGLPFMMNDPLDDLTNTEVSHEHIWFDNEHYIDGVGLTKNVGFSPNGLFTLPEKARTNYVKSSGSYNEDFMVEAINKTDTGNYSLLGDNWLLALFGASPNKNNCQDWSSRVRDNYPVNINGSIGGDSGINKLLNLGGNIFIDSAYAAELTASASYGGVSLSKTASLLLDLAEVKGAVYDDKTGQIILVGKQNMSLPRMRLDDLAVAVNSVYSGQDPGVSIDPPLVNNQYTVRYDGKTKDTEFGWVMFESDRIMKTLAMGKDNISGQPVNSAVSGYKNILDRYRQSNSFPEGESAHRFWFKPREMKLIKSPDGDSMIFDTATMEVLTESRFQDNVVGDPQSEAFAANLTQYYDDYAKEHPVFKDLRKLGQVVSVVKWLKDNDIPIDLSFILSRPKTLPFRAGMENGRSSISLQETAGFSPRSFINNYQVMNMISLERLPIGFN